MRANAQGSDPGFAMRDRLGRSLLERRSTLHFAKSIPAERRRVFCALTLPEYMESWLAIPGAAPGCLMVAADGKGFSIYCSDAESAHFTIRCSYGTCKDDELLFDWKHDLIFSKRDCLVRIRLKGEFERTNLELIHLGLHKSMLKWHRELWKNSLARLFSLFQT